jgi:glycosyltransferase involved in cell wall biosynthesis
VPQTPQEPEITAVIPTHNRADLLATTLRTVLWQQDVSVEVIVVDDGSRDPAETAATVGAFHDPRVRLVRHETPQGVCTARNHGADEARGPWLAFTDDDDLWAPDKLSSQLAAARTAGRAWSYGGAVHVSADLRLLTAKPAPAPEQLLAALPGWSQVPGGSSNVIVEAAAFEAAGCWDETLVNLADWDLWARLAQQGPPACVDRPLVGYRIHQGNASGDVDLILREARVLDERYGGVLEYGELHHYLGWVHLRSGRTRPALRQFARAAARGQVRDVGRVLVDLARRRLARRLPSLQPKPDQLQSALLAEAEDWIRTLREARADAA